MPSHWQGRSGAPIPGAQPAYDASGTVVAGYGPSKCQDGNPGTYAVRKCPPVLQFSLDNELQTTTLRYMATRKQQADSKTDDSSVLSLRFPKSLVKRLDKVAEREMRTRANLIVFLLTKGLEEQERK